MDKAACYAGDEELVLDPEFNDMVEFLLSILEHRVELLGLGDGTREPVKNETRISLKTKRRVRKRAIAARFREVKMSTACRNNDPT